ncbi:polysaccharide pyruvyl transferase family protein [Cellulomonas alba]|uniref:Polysaccharide pyruvyl transferase family protein n=1 Tax=Cellulomonas alba TaxID=3053467 RepID=A0ABT7SHB0_9CELL|nr:polysaccharide pyruvyl transferase family protein [Cellulomonas alba]MDM7855580.1 polysaccharide pyruvyl transferase family protein [Cellulomonas alba]
MRVLVLWADDHSSNLGVRALAQGTHALVEQAFPGAEVAHLQYGKGPAPMPVGDTRRLLRARFGRSAMREWLGGFDLAVDTRAGDSFADVYGLGRLTNQSTLAELTVSAGTPVVLGPQTIGPFATRRGRALARRSLRRASVVMARDSVSAGCARDLGRPVDVLATDVVFALPVPAVARTRDVVLNVSGLLWQPNPHVDHVAYRETVEELCRELLASGRRVALLAHVLEGVGRDDDVPAVREVARLVGEDAVEVVVPTSLEDVREVTASARLVVGSRMHACLNALSTGTPAVPLAYSRKFEPLLRDLGWRHVVDLRSSGAPVHDVTTLAKADLEGDVAAVRERTAALLAPAVDALRAAR